MDQKIIRHLITLLPEEMEHQYLKANYLRIENMLFQQKPIIMAGLFKTQKRMNNGVLYSKIPMTYTLANVLVISEHSLSKVEEFISKGKVNLEALLISGKLKLALSTGRSYSVVIDEIINRHRDKVHNSSSANMGGLFRMLSSGRVEGMIEFPVTIGYMAKIENINMSKMVLLPIAEVDEALESFFAFPGSEWGQDMKNKLDTILQSPEVIKKITSYYWEWLPNEELISHHKKLVTTYFWNTHNIAVAFD